MKKHYEAPTLDLRILKTTDLLSESGEAIESDRYDRERYPYGERFS
jgi:hypothetical protein